MIVTLSKSRYQKQSAKFASKMVSELTPSRGYLLRALNEWLLDMDLTPHIAVDALVPGTEVPHEFVKDGQITLNIAPGAVRDLYMDNEALSFNARFSGTPRQVYVPMAALLAIFARENGVGMGFGMEPGAEALNLILEKAHAEPNRIDSRSAKASVAKPDSAKKPGLRVVK